MCRLHLRWEAERATSLLPTMDGDLIAHPIAKGETQLAFYGSYRPPLGVLGSAADTLLLHRVAEASVHRFVKELAARVERTIPADA